MVVHWSSSGPEFEQIVRIIQIVGYSNNGIRYNIQSDFDDHILFEYLNNRVRLTNSCNSLFLA